MKYCVLAVLCLVTSLHAHPVLAEEVEKPTDDFAATMKMFLLVETMFGFNSYWASRSPQSFGVVGALFFPIGAASIDNASNTTRWVSLASAESIAIYNLRVDQNMASKSEIFRTNMLAWHAFAGIVMATSYLAGDSKEDAKTSLNYYPAPQGGMLVVNYRF